MDASKRAMGPAAHIVCASKAAGCLVEIIHWFFFGGNAVYEMVSVVAALLGLIFCVLFIWTWQQKVLDVTKMESSAMIKAHRELSDTSLIWLAIILSIVQLCVDLLESFGDGYVHFATFPILNVTGDFILLAILRSFADAKPCGWNIILVPTQNDNRGGEANLPRPNFQGLAGELRNYLK